MPQRIKIEEIRVLIQQGAFSLPFAGEGAGVAGDGQAGRVKRQSRTLASLAGLGSRTFRGSEQGSERSRRGNMEPQCLVRAGHSLEAVQ
jgi:hypothetical protein